MVVPSLDVPSSKLRFVRLAARGLSCALALSIAASCSARSTVARVGSLESEGGATLALHYQQSAVLRVRRLDAVGQPEAGTVVRFTPQGDSHGTALAGDQAVTDESGVARVTVVGGFEEASFQVLATADGAADLVLTVNVSRYPSTDLSVLFSYEGGAQIGQALHLRALVYKGRTCATLPPQRTDPKPDLEDSVAASTAAQIGFHQLPAANYAIVGRAEGATADHLLARGCVDLRQVQLGSPTVQVAVPLDVALPALDGAFALEGRLHLDLGDASPIASWVALGTCQFGVGQFVLDAISDALGPGPVGNRIVAHRGVTDLGSGCRPGTYVDESGQVQASLDASLTDALVVPGTPGDQVGSVCGDLVSIVSGFALSSRLELSQKRSPTDFLFSHALTRVTFSDHLNLHPAAYDPVALGLPVPTADGVAVSFDGTRFLLGEHEATLRLPALWGLALGDVALAPRGLPVDLAGFVAAVLDAATGNNGQPLHGCAAIQDLICQQAEVQGDCPVSAACEAAKTGLAATLGQAFDPRQGLDLSLHGACLGIDADGDLQVEALGSGVYQGLVYVSPTRTVPLSGNFTGTLIPVQ